jgi:hypothetical protein
LKTGIAEWRLQYLLIMHAIGIAICALALTAAASAESPKPIERSHYAPGRITRVMGGWNVEVKGARSFVPDHRLREAPDEIAPIAALIPGQIQERSWGWIIIARDGRVDVFKEFDGFTVTTPHESFFVIRKSARDYVLSPGKPGVRKISIEEYIDTIQSMKKRPARR